MEAPAVTGTVFPCWGWLVSAIGITVAVGLTGGGSECAHGEGPLPGAPTIIVPPAPEPGPPHACPEEPISDAPTTSMPDPSPVAPRVVFHGSRSRPVVALTFDACSGRQNALDSRVIDVLTATRTPATLFMGGEWMQENPETTRLLAGLPYVELGNHSHSHPHMTRLGPSRMREEMLLTEEILFGLTGKRSRFFRPPFVENDARVTSAAAMLGMRVAMYDVASGDADPSLSPSAIARWVVGSVHPGSVIVMHMNRPRWHSADVLPIVIGELAARGYGFVTMSELVGEEPRRTVLARSRPLAQPGVELTTLFQ